MPEYQTHKAIVDWGDPTTPTEGIEKAIKALIDALDRTNVVSIVFSKIETDGKENKTESGGTESAG